jgi:voltage-gated potassium channel Kch
MELDAYCHTEPEYPEGLNEWYVTSGDVYIVAFGYDSSGEYYSGLYNTFDIYCGWDDPNTLILGNADSNEPFYVGPLPSGAHTLYYWASGSTVSGEYAESEFESSLFRYTDVPPEITWTSPISAVWSGIVTVTASGEDVLAGVKNVYCLLGNRTVYNLNSDAVSFDFDTRNLLDGYYPFSVCVANNAGIVSSSGISVLIDNSAPSFEISDYDDVITLATYIFSGTAEDMLSGVETVEYRGYYLDAPSETWVEPTYGSGENYMSQPWEIQLSGLTDGNYFIELRSTDKAGNVTPASEYRNILVTIQV